MASYLRSSALVYAAADSTTVPLPSHVEGNLLIFVAGNREDLPVPAIVTPPSGYTQIGTTHTYDAGQTGIAIAVFYKIAGASEGDPTVEWNTGAARGTYAVVHVVEGADPTTPMDAVAAVGDAIADATSVTPGSITTQTDGALAISIVTQDDNTTLSLDTPQTFTLDDQGNTSEGSDWTHGIATKTIPTAGAVTMPTWGGGNDAWAYESFAVKPGAETKQCTGTAAAVTTTVAPGPLRIRQLAGAAAAVATTVAAVVAKWALSGTAASVTTTAADGPHRIRQLAATAAAVVVTIAILTRVVAFPSAGTPVESSWNNTPTSHPVTMPATVDANDLLLLQIICVYDVGTAITFTTPPGWSIVLSVEGVGIVTRARLAVYAKVAVGDEDSTTVDVVSNVGTNSSALSVRITGWYGSLTGVEGAAAPYDASQYPDPPNLSPSWGALNNLWIALGGAFDDDETWDVAPTNYGDLVSVECGAGLNVSASAGFATRDLNASSENPGTFTLSDFESWLAYTIAVRPASENLQLAGTSATAVTTTATLNKIGQLSGTSATVVATTAAIERTRSFAGTAAAAVTTTATLSLARLVLSGTTSAVTTTAADGPHRIRQLAGTSTTAITTTATLNRIGQLSGTSATAVTTTAVIGRTRPLAGTAATVVTTTATLSLARLVLSGTTSAVTVTTADGPHRVRQLTGTSVTAATTAADGPHRIRSFSSTSATVSTTTATILRIRTLTATAVAVTTTTGTLIALRQLTATASAATTTTAILTRIFALSSTAAATTTTTATITGVFALAGTSAAVVTTTATLDKTGLIALSGTTSAVITTLATITGTFALSAISTTVTTTTATLGRVAPLSGTSAASTVTLAGLLRIREFAATASAVCTTVGGVTRTRALTATSATVVATTGTLVALRQVSGTASATTVTTANLAAQRALSGTATVVTITTAAIIKAGDLWNPTAQPGEADFGTTIAESRTSTVLSPSATGTDIEDSRT